MLESKISKLCSTCNIVRCISFFNKDKQKKDGYRSSCKICFKIYYEKNKHVILKQKKEYFKANHNKIKECQYNYYQHNKDVITKKQRDYHEKNKIIRNKYNLKYRRNRLDTDSFFKFKETLRTLIRNSFKRGKIGYIKNISTELILGCTIDEFIDYIKSKLKEDMTIDNHGKWHIDHIVPLASAKTEEDVIRLNHYTNFQPLWAIDNLKKSSKIL